MKENASDTTVRQNGLKHLGLDNLGRTYWDLSTPALYEEAIRRYEGSLSHLGPIVIRTGQYTGRLPKDKFIVREPSSEKKIWWGKINRPLDPARFEALEYRLGAYLQGKDVFIENCYAGADEKYRIPIRVISERAGAALFARTMFIRELDPEKLARHVPEFTVCTPRISMPTLNWTGLIPKLSCCCTSEKNSFSSAAPATRAKSKNPSSPS